MFACMRKVWLTAVVAAIALGGAAALAQDVPGEAEEPSPAEPVPAPVGSGQKKGFYLGLYASVSVGSFQADPLETDIQTSPLLNADSSLEIEDMRHARAAVGWRFPEGKGDIRLSFTGFDEQEYSFTSLGLVKPVGAPLQTPQEVRISNGVLTALNRDLMTTFQEPVADSLQNQIQTVDVMYGREFGGRRFHSHWWGGLRYYEYQGNILAGAWLNRMASATGNDFTDSQFFPLINDVQETTGFGPTGAWEVDFSWFNKGLTLFLRGQSALTFSSLESDTGVFTIPIDQGGNVIVPLEIRLTEQRDKTTWQNTGELGARLLLKPGLHFEVGYTLAGYLDVLITPLALTLPDEFQAESSLCDEPETCVSANYASRDFRVDGWYATVGFQF